MPNELPADAPRSSWRALTEPLQALHLYGAAGIAAFGWALGDLLGWDATPYLGLWFCAALLIYNADRLPPDPADRLNIPRRAAASAQWRGVSFAVLAGSAVFLIAWPVLRRDWLTLALVIGGAAVCLGYSFPLFGARLKEVPLLKTFFAPTIVTAAVLVLPRLHHEPTAPPLVLAGSAAWAWSFLLFNMLLCDLRDLDGDRRTGIVSVPVRLGEADTRRLLALLLVVLEALALAMPIALPADLVHPWRGLSVAALLYLGALLLAVRRARPESFYEWWVEGMLFLPAAAVLVARKGQSWSAN